jgi:hypothetical protein
MSKRAVKLNWILEPSKFLSREEANIMLFTPNSKKQFSELCYP